MIEIKVNIYDDEKRVACTTGGRRFSTTLKIFDFLWIKPIFFDFSPMIQGKKCAHLQNIFFRNLLKRPAYHFFPKTALQFRENILQSFAFDASAIGRDLENVV